MKKIVLSYIAGVVTVLIIFAIAAQISKHSVMEATGILGARNHDDVVSTFETEHWVFLETQNRNESQKNFSKGRYGHREYLLKPKNPDLGYTVILKMDENKLQYVWIDSREDNRMVAVGIDENNQLGHAAIYGSKYSSIDKNMDGLLDFQSEGTIGNWTTSTYFTSEGKFQKEFGKPMVDDATGQSYRLNWTGSDWEKVYTN